MPGHPIEKIHPLSSASCLNHPQSPAQPRPSASFRYKRKAKKRPWNTSNK